MERHLALKKLHGIGRHKGEVLSIFEIPLHIVNG